MSQSDRSHRAEDRTPRRGKKKKKWYRPRNVILTLLLLLVAWVGSEIYRALTAKPNIVIPYGEQAMALAASWQPEGENRWSDFKTLTFRFSGIVDEFRDDLVSSGRWQQILDANPKLKKFYYDSEWYFADDFVTKGPYVPSQFRLERECIEHLEALGIFEELNTLDDTSPYIRPIEPVAGFSIEPLDLDRYPPTQSVMRVLTARMRILRHEGDSDAFCETFEQRLRFSRIMSHQPFVFDWLVASSLRGNAAYEVRASFTEIRHPDDADTVRRLLTIMETTKPYLPFDHALEGNRLMMHDLIQCLHTDGCFGNGQLIPAEAEQFLEVTQRSDGLGYHELHPIANVASILMSRRRQTSQTADRLFDRAIELSKMPPRERPDREVIVDQEVLTLPNRQQLLREEMGRRFSYIYLQNYELVDWDGTRLILALEGFHAENGRYPDALSELVPSFFSELPHDPINSEPFRYKRLTDDAEGRPYLLYSMGLDGEDNGGKMYRIGEGPSFDPSPFRAATNRDADGCDAVIRYWRRESRWDWDEDDNGDEASADQ